MPTSWVHTQPSVTANGERDQPSAISTTLSSVVQPKADSEAT